MLSRSLYIADKGLFELLPEDILKFWITSKLSFKDSISLCMTNKAMYQFFESLPNWSDTIITMDKNLKHANYIKPTLIEEITTNTFGCGITFVGSMGGFLSGGCGTLFLTAILHVSKQWMIPLAAIGGVSGALIGFGFTKLGLFAKENVTGRTEEESRLRSNIQEKKQEMVIKFF